MNDQNKSNETRVTPQAVVRAYCQISADVAAALGWQEPADCFCGETQRMPDSYRYSQKIVDFVREAVQEKIERNKAALDVAK